MNFIIAMFLGAWTALAWILAFAVGIWIGQQF